MTDLAASMADALRLTRGGSLVDATSLIQSLLSPGAAGVPGELRNVTPGASPQGLLEAPAPAMQRAAFVNVAVAPKDGRFLKQSHGGLAYRLYLPHGETAGRPLLVMLHGCTQTAEDFAAGTRMNRVADEWGFVVAYPAQSSSANAQRCWNWFKPGDQKRGRGEPALIAAMTRHLIAEHALDADRVYVAGLSAGGAAAAIMGSAYPDLYAAIGIHSGLACGAARDLPSALAAMRQGRAIPAGTGTSAFVPVITFHGDRDTTVHEQNSRDIVAAASAAAGGSHATRHEDGGAIEGRRFTRAIVRDETGRSVIEQWTIHGGGHAWSGGDSAGSYTDPTGPDASREMARFFLEHRSRR